MTESSTDGSPSSVPDTAGIGAVLYAGLFFGLGFIVLFDTTTHLSALYSGSVSAPVGRWIRVFVTSVVGSTCLLASLSIIVDTATS